MLHLAVLRIYQMQDKSYSKSEKCSAGGIIKWSDCNTRINECITAFSFTFEHCGMVMNRHDSKFLGFDIFLAAIGMAAFSASVHANWSITGLGSLGGDISFARGINDNGQVVGYAYTSSGDRHAFMTGANGVGMVDLGTLGGSESLSTSINDAGQVVGQAALTLDNPMGYHAFLAGPQGASIHDLGSLGKDYSSASGINNSGQVVGHVGVFSGSPFDYHAFVTGSNGVGMKDLGTLGGTDSFATAINDAGTVIGASFTDTGSTHAFLVRADGVGMTDLGTLGDDYSYAIGINGSGQIVGESLAKGSVLPHAFITGQDGNKMLDLGTLGGRYSSATGINDAGEAVGVSTVLNGGGNFDAFIYSHGGITDLSQLDAVIGGGWTNLFVSDINNHGQIVGYGLDSQGRTEAFLLSYTPDTVFHPQPIFIPLPVPEPETYLMWLVGLGLLGWMAVRRKRKVDMV